MSIVHYQPCQAAEVIVIVIVIVVIVNREWNGQKKWIELSRTAKQTQIDQNYQSSTIHNTLSIVNFHFLNWKYTEFGTHVFLLLCPTLNWKNNHHVFNVQRKHLD